MHLSSEQENMGCRIIICVVCVVFLMDQNVVRVDVQQSNEWVIFDAWVVSVCFAWQLKVNDYCMFVNVSLHSLYTES